MGEMEVNVIEFSWRIIVETCVHFCRNLCEKINGEKLD